MTAFRTTCGQLGFAVGFAVSGALVNGFGVANLRQRLLAQGVSPDAIPALLMRARAIVSHGLPARASQASSVLVRSIDEAYAAGLGSTMVVVAVVVALLQVITLMLLVIGALQQRTALRPNTSDGTSGEWSRAHLNP